LYFTEQGKVGKENKNRRKKKTEERKSQVK
jgi:hypothetical protein